MDVLSKVAVVCSLLAWLGSSGVQAAEQVPVPTASPTSIDFGQHDVGAPTAMVTVRFDNPTGAALQLTPQSTLLDYNLFWGSCREPVAPGGSCKVEVRFSPLTAGPHPGQLLLGYTAGADGKPTAKITVQLLGKGLPPELGVSPSRLWFPLHGPAGPGARQTIVLSNHVNRPLTIRAVTVSGEFAAAAPRLPFVLQSGEIVVLPVWHSAAWRASTGEVTILSDARENPRSVALFTAGSRLLGDFLGGSMGLDLLFAVILCLGYWLAMVAVRWHRVAMATRGDLRGEILAVKAELDALAPADAPNKKAATDLLEEACNLLDGPKDKSGNKALNILFWSRGQEINGWGYVHEAQIRMVPLLDAPNLKVRLEAAEQRLRLANEPCSTALADAIHASLNPPPPPPAPGTTIPLPAPPPDIDRMKALLAEALAVTYHREDNVFSNLVSWQNKTSWLVVCGLSAIMALTAVFPDQAILLLVGAAGGLISRLSRSLDRKDVPTDYGASWTTLFLSPVAGAVGAWAGIMIAALAANAKILGPIFQADWAHPASIGTLGVALLFGFSERLLDSVLDKLEGATGPDGTQGTLTIVNKQPSGGTLNQPYDYQLQATGATGKVLWSVVQGSALPDGLRLDSATGKISGTPTRKAIFTFTVEAADSKSKATLTLTLTVN
jgi:hypothetical protein